MSVPAVTLATIPYRASPEKPWKPWPRRSTTSLGQGEVTVGEPTSLQRYANIGIMSVGLLLAMVAWKHRDKFIGSIAYSAGVGTIGVGLAFLIFDMIGVKPGKSEKSA